MIRRRPSAGRWLFPALIALAIVPPWLGRVAVGALAAGAATALAFAVGRRVRARGARRRAIRGEAEGILLGADGRGQPVMLTEEQLSAHGLIVGASGAGKSTTALACAASGLQMVADDQVGVEADGGGYLAHMLYGTGRVFTATFEANPFLANDGTAEELRDGKVMVSPPPERLARSATVRGIVVLQTGAERSAIATATPGETLLACAPYSLVGVVGGAGYGMRRLTEMVRTVPLRRIEVKGGPEEAAELVSQVLDEVR